MLDGMPSCYGWYAKMVHQDAGTPGCLVSDPASQASTLAQLAVANMLYYTFSTLRAGTETAAQAQLLLWIGL